MHEDMLVVDLVLESSLSNDRLCEVLSLMSCRYISEYRCAYQYVSQLELQSLRTRRHGHGALDLLWNIV